MRSIYLLLLVCFSLACTANKEFTRTTELINFLESDPAYGYDKNIEYDFYYLQLDLCQACLINTKDYILANFDPSNGREKIILLSRSDEKTTEFFKRKLGANSFQLIEGSNKKINDYGLRFGYNLYAVIKNNKVPKFKFIE